MSRHELVDSFACPTCDEPSLVRHTGRDESDRTIRQRKCISDPPHTFSTLEVLVPGNEFFRMRAGNFDTLRRQGLEYRVSLVLRPVRCNRGHTREERDKYGRCKACARILERQRRLDNAK